METKTNINIITKLLYVFSLLFLLIGVYSSIDADTPDYAGHIDNQECIADNTCISGTVTTLTGYIYNTVANIGSTVSGDIVGSIRGDINSTLWGDFNFVNLNLVNSGSTLSCGSTLSMKIIGSGISTAWGELEIRDSYWCPEKGQVIIGNLYSPTLGTVIFNNSGESQNTVNSLIVASTQAGLSFNGVAVSDDGGVSKMLGKAINYDGSITQAAYIDSQISKTDYKSIINQNIEGLINGLTGKESSLSISSNITNLSNVYNNENNKGLAYYNFNGDNVLGNPSIDGNKGKIIEIKAPSDYSYLNVGKISVSGKKTIIIKGGNLYINSDMYYSNSSSDMLVIVVKRDPNHPENGGNVYINPNVTNLVGMIVADGSILNYDGSNLITNPDSLRRQLFIYGSIMTANSIGGYIPGNSKCPYGADKYNSCDEAQAKKYDFTYLRYFSLRKSTDKDSSGNAPIGFQCYNTTEKLVPRATNSGPFDEMLYAWAGKKKCNIDQSGEANLKTTEKINPFVLEYNSNIQTSDMKILRKNADN
ncbi:MAG: hypothetical protein PHS92_04150 [Candidatus Gracilibacteria bacterium]|nr:hypothetical protein [Candidatus Gracilibacteria bacterium]